MLNPKFTVQSDFVDSFLNRVVLQTKFPGHPIVQAASIFEGCVNLNKLNLNISECGNKRDEVNAFFESNDLAGFKAQVAENCTAQLLEAHTLTHLQHRDAQENALSNFMNKIYLKESLSNLQDCVSKL